MTFLLDVNVLIALLDHEHVDHEVTNRWFQDVGRKGWATCPITQNGVIRILGHPAYPGGRGDCSAIARVMAALCALPNHEFWADDVNPIASEWLLTDRLPGTKHVTDTYLLALAAARGAQLATLDRRLSVAAVPGGAEARHVIV